MRGRAAGLAEDLVVEVAGVLRGLASDLVVIDKSCQRLCAEVEVGCCRCLSWHRDDIVPVDVRVEFVFDMVRVVLLVGNSFDAFLRVPREQVMPSSWEDREDKVR